MRRFRRSNASRGAAIVGGRARGDHSGPVVPAFMKYCEVCGATLMRKRWRNGHLQSLGRFLKQRVCSLACVGKAKYQNPLKRIEKMIVVDPVSGCWNWQGAKDRDGYGQLRFNYQHLKVHRFVYTVLIGPSQMASLWIITALIQLAAILSTLSPYQMRRTQDGSLRGIHYCATGTVDFYETDPTGKFGTDGCA
jgi:hypothetical protein